MVGVDDDDDADDADAAADVAADVGCGEDDQLGASGADDAMVSHLRPDRPEICPSPMLVADGGRSPGLCDYHYCVGTDDEAADAV